MEKNQDPIWKIAMNYGAVAGLSISLFRYLTYLGNATFNSISLIKYVILIILIVFGTKILRDKLENGQIKYSRALTSGFLISIFAGIIFGFYVFLEFSFIAPEQMDEFLIIQEEAMMKMPFFDDYQIEEAINEMRESATPAKYGFSEAFGIAFWGFIFSLITSIFLKRDKPLEDMSFEKKE